MSDTADSIALMPGKPSQAETAAETVLTVKDTLLTRFASYLDGLDDAAINQLYGESGTDLFFTKLAGSHKDRVNDLGSGETNIGW